jgi:hypothetical protein
MFRAPFCGQRNPLSRNEAIERYVALRLRYEDIRRLGFLVDGLYGKTIQLPDNSPFTHADLKDTARTAFFGWFASLTDRDGRAVYAFDPLLVLFPEKRHQIILVQIECEHCHDVLQQFRSNVAFHGRAEIAVQIKARQAIREEDTFLDLASARAGFHRLMDGLVAEEFRAIPELPAKIAELRVSRHPAFANVALAARAASCVPGSALYSCSVLEE